MSATITLTPAERVAAGAAWLDEHEPGWAERIYPNRLNMESCLRCVLGQLYGGYLTGLSVGGLSLQVAEQLGFAQPMNTGYAVLTAAWRDEITRRTEVAP